MNKNDVKTKCKYKTWISFFWGSWKYERNGSRAKLTWRPNSEKWKLYLNYCPVVHGNLSLVAVTDIEIKSCTNKVVKLQLRLWFCVSAVIFSWRWICLARLDYFCVNFLKLLVSFLLIKCEYWNAFFILDKAALSDTFIVLLNSWSSKWGSEQFTHLLSSLVKRQNDNHPPGHVIGRNKVSP